MAPRILDPVPSTDAEHEATVPDESPRAGTPTLADMPLTARLGWVGWLIAAMLIVAVIAFFIVVVVLGVDNS